MFKEQMNKFKSLITVSPDNEEKGEKNSKPNKKKIENLVFFLVVLIITLIAINTILGNGKKDEDVEQSEQNGYKILANVQEDNKKDDELEERLEKILETITGVRQS